MEPLENGKPLENSCISIVGSARKRDVVRTSASNYTARFKLPKIKRLLSRALILSERQMLSARKIILENRLLLFAVAFSVVCPRHYVLYAFKYALMNSKNIIS